MTTNRESTEEPPELAPTDFLEQFALTYRFNLGHPGRFRFTPDEQEVLFLRTGPRSFVADLYALDTQSGVERVVSTAETLLGSAEEELSDEERALRERLRLASRGITQFEISPDGSQILVPLSGRLFLIERVSGERRELVSESGPAFDARFSPDGAKIAVVRNRELYVIDVASGRERKLTDGANENLEHGLAEFVAQEEMSRYHGYWWSPDSSNLLVQETDTSDVERLHILDPLHPERSPHGAPYPRPGMSNARVRLGLASISGGPMRPVEWDRERYPYLNSVVWSENAPLTLVVQDRSQQEQAVLAFDIYTRSVSEPRVLLTEHDDAWLNIDQSMPRWLADGQRFVWASEREGAWRVELRDASGALIRQLTPLEGFGYRSLLAVDETRSELWFGASPEPTESHIARVGLEPEASAARWETNSPGQHDAVVSKRGAYWVETLRAPDEPRRTSLHRRDGSSIEIASFAEQPPFNPNVDYQALGDREFRAAIIRPRNFVTSRRYPVLVHVYGGPGVNYVTKDRDRWLLQQWFADHGFIVVTFDGRGTPHRGREWERAIRGDFSEIALEDQVAALEACASRFPELDLTRVGIYGWSFGGYLSAMAALRRPDIYRVAIAGAPVSEWRDYDTHYTERYLGLPEPIGADGAYARSSVLTYATRETEGLRASALLLIHGTSDDNVYFSHAVKLSDALFRAGREHAFLPLAGLTHMVPDPNISRRLQTKMIDFLSEHLGPE